MNTLDMPINVRPDVIGEWLVKKEDHWKTNQIINLSAYGELNDFQAVGFFEELRGLGIITNKENIFLPLEQKESALADKDIFKQYFIQKGICKDLGNSLKNPE